MGQDCCCCRQHDTDDDRPVDAGGMTRAVTVVNMLTFLTLIENADRTTVAMAIRHHDGRLVSTIDFVFQVGSGPFAVTETNNRTRTVTSICRCMII
jgi:hypothetical protein